MELVLIRHAEPERVVSTGGRADPELTPRGREQARRTAAWLEGEAIAAVWSSPLRRAVQTAEPLAAALGQPVLTDERLSEFDPANADIRNNMGLNLHYSGQSSEALTVLAENVAAHPEHQRSWLTLGFVNSQLGDAAASRRALETAISIDPASDVGQSAQNMLDGL